MVRLGSTLVVAGVTYQVGEPSQNFPLSGDIEFGVTLSSLCSPTYDKGKHDNAYELERSLYELFNSSGILDYEQLSIQKFKFAVRLCVDVICLSHDGNLFDAIVIAVISALNNTKLPAFSLKNDTVIEAGGSRIINFFRILIFFPLACHSLSTHSFTTHLTGEVDSSVSVSLSCVPIPVSCALFENKILIDPSLQEDKIVDAHMSVVFGVDGSILYLRQVISLIFYYSPHLILTK